MPSRIPHSTLILLVAASLAACKSEQPDAKAGAAAGQAAGTSAEQAKGARPIKLEFDEAGAPVGAKVSYGAHEIGVVTKAADSELVYVEGTLPAEFDEATGFGALSIDQQTPCGRESVVLTPVPEEGREVPRLRFDASEASSAKTLVWTDLPKAKVVFGEAKVEAELVGDHYLIERLDCELIHPVTVNGERVEDFEAFGEGLIGVWVAKDASTCYEVTTAKVGDGWTQTTSEKLSGGRLYNFPHERIDYRFEPMPKALEPGAGEKVAINEIDCAEVD